MASYIQSVNGYIADSAEVYFNRCDKKVFYFDQCSSSSFTPTFNQLEITGGWGLFPLAFINTGSTLEASFTSSQFSMDIFEGMSNVTAAEDTAFEMYHSAILVAGSDFSVDLPHKATAGSTFVYGLEATTVSPAPGKYILTDVALEAGPPEVPAHTKLTFDDGDVASGDTVRVIYKTIVTAERARVLTSTMSARGEVTMKWPVYSSGTDCSEAAVKGYVILTIYMARVTAMPGFDTSYKTAATNSVTFSAIDPRRADGQMYSISYVPAN